MLVFNFMFRHPSGHTNEPISSHHLWQTFSKLKGHSGEISSQFNAVLFEIIFQAQTRIVISKGYIKAHSHHDENTTLLH